MFPLIYTSHEVGFFDLFINIWRLILYGRECSAFHDRFSRSASAVTRNYFQSKDPAAHVYGVL